MTVYPERTDVMIAASSGGTRRRLKTLTFPTSCISLGDETGRSQDRGAENAQHLGRKLMPLALTRRPR